MIKNIGKRVKQQVRDGIDDRLSFFLYAIDIELKDLIRIDKVRHEPLVLNILLQGVLDDN